jgi:hypothetical protein
MGNKLAKDNNITDFVRTIEFHRQEDQTNRQKIEALHQGFTKGKDKTKGWDFKRYKSYFKEEIEIHNKKFTKDNIDYDKFKIFVFDHLKKFFDREKIENIYFQEFAVTYGLILSPRRFYNYRKVKQYYGLYEYSKIEQEIPNLVSNLFNICNFHFLFFLNLS